MINSRRKELKSPLTPGCLGWPLCLDDAVLPLGRSINCSLSREWAFQGERTKVTRIGMNWHTIAELRIPLNACSTKQPTGFAHPEAKYRID